MPLPSLPRPPPTPLLSIGRLFSRRKHPDSEGLVSGTPRICESSGVCDTGGGCGEEQFLVSGKGVRRALEAEPQNRLPVPPVVPPPLPGWDLRALSGLPTSADSAWLTPHPSALILVGSPSLGTLLPPWATRLGLCPRPGIPLGTEAAHVPVLLSALPGPHLARRLHQVP